MSNFLSKRRGRLARPVICNDKRVLFVEPLPILCPPILEVRFYWTPPGSAQSLLYTIVAHCLPGFVNWFGSAGLHGATETAWIHYDLAEQTIELALSYTALPDLHWSVTSPAASILTPASWYAAWPHFNLIALPPVNDPSLRA